jgi:hypothetical protein
MQEAANLKQFDLLLVHSSNRPARNLPLAIKFIDEQILGNDLRLVSVSPAIDTAVAGWRVYFSIHGVLDEAAATAHNEPIRESRMPGRRTVSSRAPTHWVTRPKCSKDVPPRTERRR